MKRLRSILLILLTLAMLGSYAYAAFPYSVKWLRYSDDRIIYQIDVSGVTSNTANIYVEFTVDQTFLQNFINKWSSYCDPSGKYPWFYPTVEYASTKNNDPRFAKIVEMNNFVTFTVGSCGSVQLPTKFKVLLPNGVLDGGDDYSNYQHYLFVNYKYPYVWDFEETMGIYPTYVLGSPDGTVSYNTGYEQGYNIVPGANDVFAPVNITVNTETDDGKYVLCGYVHDITCSYCNNEVWLSVHTQDDNTFIITSKFNGVMCVDIASALEKSGHTGIFSIDGVGAHDDGDAGTLRVYWIWLIPDSIMDSIRSGN